MYRIALLCIITLTGCWDKDPDQNVRASRKTERRAAAELAAAAPPRQRVQYVDGHQLITVETTVNNGGFAEVQRCYIWRDTEFKTASMQCPVDTSVSS